MQLYLFFNIALINPEVEPGQQDILVLSISENK